LEYKIFTPLLGGYRYGGLNGSRYSGVCGRPGGGVGYWGTGFRY